MKIINTEIKYIKTSVVRQMYLVVFHGKNMRLALTAGVRLGSWILDGFQVRTGKNPNFIEAF